MVAKALLRSRLYYLLRWRLIILGRETDKASIYDGQAGEESIIKKKREEIICVHKVQQQSGAFT